MAAKPTPGGSDGTYGTELNEFLDVSLAADGKVKDGAVFSTSAAPTVDAGVANKAYVDGLAVKGWVQFDGTGTPSITGSFNVSSITDNGTGDYTVNWDTNFADATYVVSVVNSAGNAFVVSIAAGSVRVRSANSSFVLTDDALMFVMAIGTQ